ncbi:MAG: right-handed parallel beta-helix repeat-containing protein [Ginsengibacter sp.]
MQKSFSSRQLTGVLFTFFCQFIILNAQGQNYCTPNADCSVYQIDSVGFSNIHNESGCSANGYADYTSTVPAGVVQAGTYVKMSVKLNATSQLRGVTVGIDFNHNGIWEKNEVVYLGESKSMVTDFVRIPFEALTGNTRLRIRLSYAGGIADLCAGGTIGETEDYSLQITAPSTPGPDFTFYVNKSGTGKNVGLSWADAFPDLESALHYAQGRDTIKVASGIYKRLSQQGALFNIKDSIVVLGGYPDHGNPTDADRNFAINQTILSGETATGGRTSYNIVAANNLPGEYAPKCDNFIFDGFIIENAGNIAFSLYNVQGATIKNCVFRKNTGGGEGVALSADSSKLTISNCYFYNNSAGNISPTNVSLASIVHHGTASFFNCLFANNEATKGLLVHPNGSTAQLVNCTIANNHAFAPVYAESNATLSVANSIFYNNINNGSIDSTEIKLQNSVININNTITQVYDYGNQKLLSKDPKFKDTANVVGNDNLYFTSDDGLQLLNPCSPAINAGLNSVNGTTTDLLGHQRIFGTNIDLGAIEVQSEILPMPKTLYVNTLAVGNNDGSSWANAFTDFQKALYYCSDTIRVAAGTYYPSVADASVSCWLQNKRVILGGYPASGNPSDQQRDPEKYPTILSGNLPNGLKSDIILRGRTVDSTAVIDGITVSDGNGSYYLPHIGSVYLINNSNPTFNNCIFKNNSSSALFNVGSSPEITNSIFENNTSLINGRGGGANINIAYSNPKFFNCTFRGNKTYLATETPYMGGAVFNLNSAPTFDSCLFLKNTANNFGGAMANVHSNANILRCRFEGNNVTPDGYFGGNAIDIYNDASSPVVTHTLFSDSNGCNLGGSIQNINLSNGTFQYCEFRNGNAYFGGGVCANDNSGPTFLSCVFTGARANSGAVMYNVNQSNPAIINCLAFNNLEQNGQGCFMYSDNSRPVVTNSTIVKNMIGTSGSGVIADNNAAVSTITNSILWGNSFIYSNQAPAEIVGNSSSNTVIRNSLTQSYGKNGVNGNIVGMDPRLIDINDLTGPDSIFFTSDDGGRLCDCSPAIDRGETSAVNSVPYDILSNPRIVNNAVDIGAYEYQSPVVHSGRTYYVNAAATGTNDGTSWANAYKELRTALANPCADTIKVAMGTYKPASVGRDSSFLIDRGITILGGYANSAHQSDSSRDPDKYPTILSGDIGKKADSTDNTYRIMQILQKDTTVTIDGFIFDGSNNNKNISAPGSGTTTTNGGAIYISTVSKVSVNNCRFYDNYALTGSAVYIEGDRTTVSHCVFTENHAGQGTLVNNGPDNVIKNCIFYKNKANYYGGGVYQSNGTFTNVIFYKNEASVGAGVYTSNTGVKFINCDFIKNNATSSNGVVGIGLYSYHNYSNDPNNILVRNCIFKDNTVANYAIGSQYSDWAYIKKTDNSYDQLDLDYSASYSTSQYNNTHNISPAAVTFQDEDNPIGPDGLWFTADDGLIPDACSKSIDNGDNNSVTNIETDIMVNNRIYNQVVDIGAYEYQGYSAPFITITSSDSSICPGQTVVFTAQTTNAGTSPTYEWHVNGIKVGENKPVYTGNSFKNGDRVVCVLISNSGCVLTLTAVSDTITLSVIANAMPSLSISTPQNPVCQGSSATFAATAINGGTAPVYHWQINGINTGDSSEAFTTDVLKNNDTIKCMLISSLACANPDTVESNTVVMVVKPLPTANAGNDTSICKGTSINLNGTGGTGYSWYPATGLSNPDIANPVAEPLEATTYVLTVSDNGICTAKDTIRIDMKPSLTPSISISSDADSICSTGSVNFSAVISNGGSAPVYQWQVNGYNVGANIPNFSASNLNNDFTVICQLTSNAACTVSSTVISNAVPVKVITLSNPLLSINDHTLTITNPDADAQYTWQVFTDSIWINVTPQATGITFSTEQTGQYRVRAEKHPCLVYSDKQNFSLRRANTNPFGIYFYPNPTSGILIVDQISPTQNWRTLEITDAQGKLMVRPIDITGKKSITLHVDNFLSGIYFIELTRNDGQITQFEFVKSK